MCCWTVVRCVLGDSAAWTVSCVPPDGVCLRRGVQNHFGQHFSDNSWISDRMCLSKNFIKKYLIGKGLFRQHKKWFFGSYRKWPFLTRCFRQHKKWPKADFYGIKSGSERKWYSDKTHFMEWKILSDFIGLGNGNLDEIESSNFKLKRNKCLEDSAYHTVSPQPGFNFWVAKKPRVIPACHFTAGNGDIINRPTFLSLV